MKWKRTQRKNWRKLSFERVCCHNYYIFNHWSEEVSELLFTMMQTLNANMEFIKLESCDGKMLTCFINEVRDFSVKLARFLEENLTSDIVAFDSVKTQSGVRIVTLEQNGRKDYPLAPY